MEGTNKEALLLIIIIIIIVINYFLFNFQLYSCSCIWFNLISCFPLCCLICSSFPCFCTVINLFLWPSIWASFNFAFCLLLLRLSWNRLLSKSICKTWLYLSTLPVHSIWDYLMRSNYIAFSCSSLYSFEDGHWWTFDLKNWSCL